MDSNYVEIEINGRTYYIEADRLPDLAYINNKLVNTSNSTIYLVTDYSTETTYPRIQCSAMSQCRYYGSYSSSYQAVTSNYTLRSNFSIYQIGSNGIQSAILFALMLILGAKLIWKR